jgi:N-acyl-D-amino-acid deacylase
MGFMMRFACALLLAVYGASVGALSQARAPYDVVIRNGRVLDGSGNPWLRRDIAIAGDRIVALGNLSEAQATRVVDAADRIVAPGFIDVHSHAAEGLARSALRHGRALIAQGVTTIVANPDGGGPVNLAGQRQQLETGQTGPNIALLIGHGSVRREVMGTANRAPTAEELERMRLLVRGGMEEGAYGLSSGLFYAPASFAATEELIALAAVAAEYGGVYTSHIRDEANYTVGLLASVDEVIRIADEAHVIGIVTHMKALGPESWGLSVKATGKIDAARARGVQVFADQYPYEASSTSLRAALLPGDAQPTEATIRDNLRRRGGAKAIQIAAYKPDRTLEGKTLAQIAAEKQGSPEEVALDLISRGNASIVSFNMSEDDIRHIMTRPYTMASSDGGMMLPSEGTPHPRDYGAFARRLGMYVREKGVVDLEFAVRSMTSLPAAVFSLRDRGAIRVGAFADVVIFDPARVREVGTYADPHHLAEGMSHVLVNGVLVLDNGSFTDAVPGRVLRKAREE